MLFTAHNPTTTGSHSFLIALTTDRATTALVRGLLGDGACMMVGDGDRSVGHTTATAAEPQSVSRARAGGCMCAAHRLDVH